jgi:3-hydroxyisobutyrate dehydrogenase-like beta-hydroxyacid dehydrogenase
MSEYDGGFTSVWGPWVELPPSSNEFNCTGVAVSEMEIEIELLALDSERFRSMVNQDVETLERLLDDELVWTHASAVRDGKQSFLERLTAGSIRYLEITRSEEEVRLFDNVAIVGGVANIHAMVNGSERFLTNRYNNVWLKRAGSWRMVNCQSTAMPVAAEPQVPNQSPVISETIGWIGAGRIGSAMAMRLIQGGYNLAVCEPNEAARAALEQAGASHRVAPADCTRASKLIFCSLPDDRAVEAVVFGRSGILEAATPGLVLVDLSTISPATSARVAAETEKHGIAYLRVPVSGNPTLAQQGRLTVLVSGPRAAWEQVQPVVQAFSSAQRYLGDGEQSRYLKLVINSIVMNLAPLMAEALTLGRKGGLDWTTMIDGISASPIASPWLQTKLEALRRRDFSPTMSPRLILKDLDLMLEAARQLGMPMPVTASTRQLMQVATIGAGAEDDFFTVVKLIEQQSGLPTEGVVGN